MRLILILHITAFSSSNVGWALSQISVDPFSISSFYPASASPQPVINITAGLALSRGAESSSTPIIIASVASVVGLLVAGLFCGE